MSVFRAAAKYHPLVGHRDSPFESQGSEVKRIIAQEHGMDWPELHRRLFADLIEHHRLREFQGFANAPMMLARYNVAQVQIAQSLKEKLAIVVQHPMVVYKASIPIEPVLQAWEVIRFKPCWLEPS